MNVFESYFDAFNFGIDLRLVLLICAVSFYAIYYLKPSKRKLPPGPRGLPFVGYWPFLGREPYKTLNNLGKKYGNVFSLRLGRELVVVCNDWNSMKDCYLNSKSLNRPPELFEALPNGFGFAGANGQTWVEQRRFSSRTMKEIGMGRPHWEELMQEEVKDIVKLIRERDGQTVDANELFSDTFLNNVLTLLLGYRMPFGHPMVSYMSKTMDIIMQEFVSLGLGNFLPRLYSFLSTITFSKSPEKMKEYSRYISKCVGESLQNTQKDDQDSFVKRYAQELQNNKRNNTQSSFTDGFLYGNTQVLILGGSETTRTTMLWLLLTMAQFPEKQALVHEELDRVLGKDGCIQWSERTTVPYTYATIMESQRWATIVPINTLRMTYEDMTVLGFEVPKGTMITSNVWAIHNDPKFWPEPEKFEPERFLLNEGKQINFKPDSFMPFSFGKRSCPGELIAMMEILLYFTTLMQKFTVSPAEGGHRKEDTVLGLTFQPLNVKLRLVPRE